MIEDIEAHEEGAVLRADVCVVGTGHAGMEVIRTLRRAGLSVVVAEGGRRAFSKALQALTRMEVVGREVREPDPEDTLTPYLPPELRGEGRLRQLGGNSNIWTGKWREFEPLDFRGRAHVPHSGWPIEHAEMLGWYREIERDYGFAAFERFGADPDLAPLREALGDELAMSFHYWEAEPLRVVERFGAEIEADRGARVVMGANAVELLRGEGGRIEALRARSTEGREIRLEADQFVLAAGGIEVPRLLLASDGRDPRGIGNEHDLVGRFFQEHPKLKRGLSLHPGPRFAALPHGAANLPKPRVKLCLSLPEAVQSREGLLNHILQFAPPPPEMREWRAALRARQPGQAARLLMRGGRIAGDGLSGETVKAAFIVEQAPNPESRVLLGEARDGVGMRVPRLDWRLSSLDARSFPRALELLRDALARAGIGRLDWGAQVPSIEQTVDCRHHMGTTRMGATPRTGVVDADCRVYGTPNLSIASSSVFPTGHSYGPTLTIVALARKAASAVVRERDRVAGRTAA